MNFLSEAIGRDLPLRLLAAQADYDSSCIPEVMVVHVPQTRKEIICPNGSYRQPTVHLKIETPTKGHVVRREPGPEPHLTGVGLVFTEELDPDSTTE